MEEEHEQQDFLPYTDSREEMDALQTEEECNVHWSLTLQLLYNLHYFLPVQQNLQQEYSI